MTEEQIAELCHETNGLYCRLIGDQPQAPWENAEQWQRDSAVAGVKFRLENPTASDSAQHEAWLKDKVDNEWVYGPVKDPEKKEHPCCVPYGELPIEQRRKDGLFSGIVDACTRG